MSYIKFIYKKMRIYRGHSPVTFEYPYTNKHIHVFSRLEIKNDFSECSACGICEKVCPTNAIKISGEKYSKDMRRNKTGKGYDIEMEMNSFQINYADCIFCGLCIRDCPTGSLTNSKSVAASNEEIRLLTKDLKADIKPNFRGKYRL